MLNMNAGLDESKFICLEKFYTQNFSRVLFIRVRYQPHIIYKLLSKLACTIINAVYCHLPRVV